MSTIAEGRAALDRADKTAQQLLDEIRNSLPHLVTNNQDPATLRVFWGLGVIDGALRQLADLERVIARAVEATTLAGLQSHPTTWSVESAPAEPAVLIDVDKPDGPENRYLTKVQADDLVKLLDSPRVEPVEKNKMLLSLPKLSQARADLALEKLRTTIKERQDALDAAANQDLVDAHEIPAAPAAQLTPQQVRDQKQAEQYGGVAEADQFDAQQGTPAKPKGEGDAQAEDFAAVADGAKKQRAKKAKPEVEPAGELSVENLLKPTGNEDQLIDEAQPRTGANIYASLAQKTKLLQAAQDPKVTNGERSKLFLAINKISYAEAERSQAKLAAWIKDRPTPDGVIPSSRKPVAPAVDVKPNEGAVSPSTLPWEQ